MRLNLLFVTIKLILMSNSLCRYKISLKPICTYDLSFGKTQKKKKIQLIQNSILTKNIAQRKLINAAVRTYQIIHSIQAQI